MSVRMQIRNAETGEVQQLEPHQFVEIVSEETNKLVSVVHVRPNGNLREFEHGSELMNNYRTMFGLKSP